MPEEIVEHGRLNRDPRRKQATDANTSQCPQRRDLYRDPDCANG
jgi:hypothetical protein